MAMSLTYSRYLALDELLALQRPRSAGPEHDETLFIVIHQVYELWFKQILHELDYLARLFASDAPADGTLPRILHTLKRVLTILKTLVAQVDILETMTPTSFSSFRARLEAASGFQSSQFRELEFLLGMKRPALLAHHRENPAACARLEERLAQATVYQAFLRYLIRRGYAVAEEHLEPRRDAAPIEAPEIRAVLLDVYRHDDRLTQVCERLVDLDEGLQEWRYRHVKMVERTIGSKPGTGGSPGADYLRQTLFKPFFPDLWAIRTEL
ncbi:MAG: tryptophan 2,3-dioxygenase [Acidobacteria bacterium]|nr:MAG: tryptophan 2,3-dioxygenase [Acidobacteriota bacterium]